MLRHIISLLSITIYILCYSINLYADCISGNCENGYGTYIDEKQFIYKGLFKDGKKHGAGTLYNEKEQKIYEGDWVKGEQHGYGIIYYLNGKKKYEGDFQSGKQNGKGTLYWHNGNQWYDGGWKDGEWQGHGVVYNEIGSHKLYEGEYNKGILLYKKDDINSYNIQLYHKIRNNWYFNKEAIGKNNKIQVKIVVNILQNGDIKNISVIEKSGNTHLDNAALSAIKKSNPFPPLPKGYKSYDIGFIFKPSGI